MTSDQKSPSPEANEPQHRADPQLLEILVCPVTKGPLVYRSETQELLSLRADVAFPIRNGVPLMTLDAARPLTDQERANAKSSEK